MPHRFDFSMTATATGAIASPWWLPTLHDVSTIAAELAPIVGLIVLLLQIYLKVADYLRRRTFHRELREQLDRSNHKHE